MENLDTNKIQNLLMSFPSSDEQSHIIRPADHLWPSTSTDFHGQTDQYHSSPFPLPKCRFFTNLPRDDQEGRLIKRLMCSSNAPLHSQPSDFHDELKKCAKQDLEEQNEDQEITRKEGRSLLLNREATGKGGRQTLISSHSLAERVRRERINERMRFLQDLVPGCNKITGKALMLDEIINYVQSLQRQVEFLSMKLAALYSEMEVLSDNYLKPLLSEDVTLL